MLKQYRINYCSWIIIPLILLLLLNTIPNTTAFVIMINPLRITGVGSFNDHYYYHPIRRGRPYRSSTGINNRLLLTTSSLINDGGSSSRDHQQQDDDILIIPSVRGGGGGGSSSSSGRLDVETALQVRYACKKFRRSNDDDNTTTPIDNSTNTTNINTTTKITKLASVSDMDIIQTAYECLNIARLAPSGFNTQPYKLLMIYTTEQKMKLAKCVLGPNKDRVLDSDCTVLFLADKRICTTFRRYIQFMKETSQRQLSNAFLHKSLLHITVFSSGYPFVPRFISTPLSFVVRCMMSVMNWFTKSFYPMPSVSSAETWATKQIMLVAMAYMLTCTSRGLVTIPMEGINAALVRSNFNIPSRYAIPVIVSTGVPFTPKEPPTDDNITKRRYPVKEIIYDNVFGNEIPDAIFNLRTP